MPRSPSFRLLLALVAVFLLGAAALALSGGNAPAFRALNGAGARWLPAGVASDLTILGNGLVAVMLLALLLPWQPRLLAAGLHAAPLAGLFSALGKRLAHAPRPAAVLDPAGFHVEGPLLAGSNAFPSGHTITIFLVAGVLLLGLDSGTAAARGRWVRAAAVLALAALVGVSRILVGAHWPSDVLGGAALGLLSAMAGDALARRWPYWHHRAASVAFALVVLACAVALARGDTGYPLALPLQWGAIVLGSGAALLTLFRQGRGGRPLAA